MLLMFGLHFLLMGILYFLKPARDSLFLTENGPGELPYVYILLALVSIPVTQVLTNVMNRYPVRRVLSWTLGFLAINILLIRWGFELANQWIFMVFYIWVGIFGILVISLFWILANAVFEAAQSKRIFSFLTLGAILGAIVGSEASSLVVSLLDLATEDLLFICVALLLLCMGMLYVVNDSRSAARRSNKTGESSPSVAKAARTIWKSHYQLTIASIIGLTMVATTITDYQFKAIAFDAYPDTAGLTAFMGTFYAGISLASLGIQVLLSNQIVKQTGLLGTILSRPVGMMLGAVMMAVEPVLASVIILNGFDGATRYSIDKTGRELLFLPLSQHVKEQTKVFIDIFVDRFARGLGGVMLLALVVWLEWSVYPLTFIIIALLGVWVVLGVRAKRGYISKFREALQKQLISTDSIALNLDEASILDVVRESLRSENDMQVLHTLFLLEGSQYDMLAADLYELLSHDNTQVKLKALQLLQEVDSVSYTEKAEELLKENDPDIRLETIYYLCQHSKEDPSQIIRSYLMHEDNKLKSAALGCTCKHGGTTPEMVDDDLFRQLMNQEGQEAVVVKAQLADALGYVDDQELAYRYLPALLEDDHTSVVRKVIASMGRQQDDRYLRLLINKLEDFEYSYEIKKNLARYGTDYLILFKDRFRDRELSYDVRKHMPGIFAYLGKQQSVDHLLDMARIEDPVLRYHIIKSLNKLVREYPDLAVDVDKIRSIIRREARLYFELLAIKLQQPESRPNMILLKALSEKMTQAVERIFRLLGLIYDSRDMHGTYLALQSLSSEKRSAAVEFLDNVLEGEDLEYLFPIVDELDESARLQKGRNLFAIPDLPYDQGLMSLIDGDDRWLKACAIYSVSPECPASLQTRVKEAAKSREQIIRETAELVLQRNEPQVQN